ncbi:MAG: hypothetical protein A2138_01290 [Deltaproteobacteria bacterium RBG_16_71_12]|nr:MAG: hypothetical protein A2138_01290 [Deltaproteobacteria bacterium RBG_16_71_12]
MTRMRRSATTVTGLLLVATAATSARAAQFTTLTVDAPTLAQPRYSQAIEVVAHLSLATDGAAVPGTACAQGCRVQVSIGPESEPGTFFFVSDPVADAAGVASTRLTFVDGRYGTDSAFVAADDGAPWVVRACFLGYGVAPGAPCEPSPAAACAPAAVEDPNGDLCPSAATRTIALFPEIPSLALGLGFEGKLGTELVVSAEVSDATGDAAPGGTDVDGPQPTLLVGVPVQFFYDADNDGRPSLNESIGSAETNAAGVASVSFVLDPQYVLAGSYDNGIHAEFSGDDRYGVGRSSARLVVRPGDLDLDRTIIEVEPDVIPADNVSIALVRVRLVDEFNNQLDETSEPHDVVVTTDLGRLLDEVERDPTQGFYSIELQATRAPGTATVTVTVDGTEVGTASVEMVGESCNCAHAHRGDGADGAAAATALVVCGVAFARRRGRR